MELLAHPLGSPEFYLIWSWRLLTHKTVGTVHSLKNHQQTRSLCLSISVSWLINAPQKLKPVPCSTPWKIHTHFDRLWAKQVGKITNCCCVGFPLRCSIFPLYKQVCSTVFGDSMGKMMPLITTFLSICTCTFSNEPTQAVKVSFRA